MNTSIAMMGPHSGPSRTKYTTRAAATMSSETRSSVESRNAPAVVGPAPARATAPSSASHSEAMMPTTSAHPK